MLEMSSCESSSEEDQIVLKKRTKIVSNVLSESEAEDQMESSDDKTETSNDLQSSILNKQDQDNVKNEDFEAFKRNLSRMVDEHKMSLKKLRQEERANDEEFFALVTYQNTGELPSADNTTVYLPVMHEGINLMQVPAGSSAAKFGRHLGCAMYGKGELCKLQSLIIGAHRRRKDIRTPVPEDERAKFELVVRRKYPKFPEAAYKDARHAANQLGLDIKLKLQRGSTVC